MAANLRNCCDIDQASGMEGSVEKVNESRKLVLDLARKISGAIW